MENNGEIQGKDGWVWSDQPISWDQAQAGDIAQFANWYEYYSTGNGVMFILGWLSQWKAKSSMCTSSFANVPHWKWVISITSTKPIAFPCTIRIVHKLQARR